MAAGVGRRVRWTSLHVVAGHVEAELLLRCGEGSIGSVDLYTWNRVTFAIEAVYCGSCCGSGVIYLCSDSKVLSPSKRDEDAQ